MAQHRSTHPIKNEESTLFDVSPRPTLLHPPLQFLTLNRRTTTTTTFNPCNLSGCSGNKHMRCVVMYKTAIPVRLLRIYQFSSFGVRLFPPSSALRSCVAAAAVVVVAAAAARSEITLFRLLSPYNGDVAFVRIKTCLEFMLM
jgi:hypothetical protein